MKKAMITLMAVTLFATTMPAFAMEHEHGSAHEQSDVQCAKDCDMLLKDCSREVDTLQQRVKKLKLALKTNGADQKTVDDLRILDAKLKEANELLKSLSKPGH